MARILPSSDISHTEGTQAMNKYGAGGGASPFSTWYENLLVSNSDTSWVGNTLEGGADTFIVSVGMASTITADSVWQVYLNGTIDVFNSNAFETTTPTRIKIRITDANGDYFESADLDVSSGAAPGVPYSLREQWVDWPSLQIDCSGAPVGSGGTANSCSIIVSGSGENPAAYFGITYFAIELATHTITASSDAHSAWDQEGAIVVNDGASLTLNASVDETYRITDVLVDDVSVGDAAGETTYQKQFTNVTADHTISVTAAIPQPVVGTNVVVTNANHGLGQVTADAASAVVGETVRFHITPAPGQRTSRLVVDGNDISGEVDPLNDDVYQIAMDIGDPIVLDYVIIDVAGADLEVEFDGLTPSGMITSYHAGTLQAGMGNEDIASRMERINRAPF